ncbi:hypothetical protein RJ639_018846 [Escallonia herrerae]|uniref:Uncharacterized protein n=1 Tax=Escallonia herrerae TaxID=1293975 RepID=A0AA88V886_9ASTE|nr:hypothetical protein RJ639_018846 [Escallonia herrerae]
MIANCLQRQMMNAFFDNIGQVQRGEQSGSQSRHPPTEEQTDSQDYEEEDAVEAFPQWCNAVTMQVGNPEESLTREKPKDMPPKKKGDVPGKGLMYVDIKANEKAIRAMTGEGYQLCRTASSGDNEICIDQDWPIRRKDQLSVVIMDDFKLILGLEFLRDTKTTVMSCTNSLAMLGSKPCVIPTISPRAGERSISALQLKKGLKRDETAYLAILWWDKIEEVSGPLPKEVKVMLNDFEDGLGAASRSALFGGVLLALIEGARIMLNKLMSAPQIFPPMEEPLPNMAGVPGFPMGQLPGQALVTVESLGGGSSPSGPLSSLSSDSSSSSWFEGLFGGGKKQEADASGGSKTQVFKSFDVPTPPSFDCK